MCNGMRFAVVIATIEAITCSVLSFDTEFMKNDQPVIMTLVGHDL